MSWHSWSDRRIKSTCQSTWVTWLGPGGCGKSTDSAAQALEYWLESPHTTAVIVCSTSLAMLKRRIWSEIVRLHAALPFKDKGELIATGTIIRWQHGDEKHGIFGVAIAEGSIEEARSQLIGVHTERVWWIVDEMQSVKPALLDPFTLGNLYSNPEARFLGMGNPSNLEDPLCRHSRPVGGWESVKRGETETWETHGGPGGRGVCVFFDGRKSPAVLDPAWGKAHPWMISKTRIDQNLRFLHGNENDPAFWSQSIGWPPSSGTESTVLDASIIESFRCKEKAIWTDGFKQYAALDPAFTFGGDRRILQFFKLGRVQEEGQEARWVIEFKEWFNVPISEIAKNEDGTAKPIEYQILEFCRSECEQRGMKPEQFALDSSGRGGSLKAIFDSEWGPVNGVDFGGAASELPVKSFTDSDGNLVVQLAREIYARRVAELNLTIREFALSNGIRGMSNEVAAQGCARKTFFKGGKWGVQPKKEMPESPDNLDAAAVAVDFARQKGAIPTIQVIPAPRMDDWRTSARQYDQDYSSENYAEAYDWKSA